MNEQEQRDYFQQMYQHYLACGWSDSNAYDEALDDLQLELDSGWW